MIDTHAIVRRLTGAGLSTEQADAITDAVREAAKHGDHVTPEAIRAELASLEASPEVALRRCDARTNARDPRRRARDAATVGVTRGHELN